MNTHSSNWAEIAAEGIVGDLMKCAKGLWSISNVSISTGADGVTIALLMPTAITGAILWRDGKIAETDTGLVEQGRKPPKSVPDGWSPDTSIQGVLTDEAHAGQLRDIFQLKWARSSAPCGALSRPTI